MLCQLGSRKNLVVEQEVEVSKTLPDIEPRQISTKSVSRSYFTIFCANSISAVVDPKISQTGMSERAMLR